MYKYSKTGRGQMYKYKVDGRDRMHAWLSNIHTCHIIITAAFDAPHYYN